MGICTGCAGTGAVQKARPTATAVAVQRSDRPGGGYVEQASPGQGQLTTLPGGVVLLPTTPHGPDDNVTTPVQGSPGWTWQPAQLLPAPRPQDRHVDVFYAPHPDDETLSMGVLITAAVQRGDRVILVGLADGRTTGAVRAISTRLAAEHHGTTAPGGTTPGRATPGSATRPGGLSRDQVGAARDAELRRAATDLGIRPDDLVLAHLDAPDSDDGAIITVTEAEQVMRTFAARYPGATHVTMSDVAEHQQDHLDAGVALHQLLSASAVTAAAWTVSRLWWHLPGPTWTWALPTPTERDRIRRAAREYLTWNPAYGEYAFGFYSVRWQFAALDRDVRDRVHTDGPPTPGVTARRPVGRSSSHTGNS